MHYVFTCVSVAISALICLSLPLSLSHKHTHTLSLSLSLTLSNSNSNSVSLSLSWYTEFTHDTSRIHLYQISIMVKFIFTPSHIFFLWKPRPPPVTLKRIDEGYSINFTPISKGLHLLHVALNGEDIKVSLHLCVLFYRDQGSDYYSISVALCD